MFKLQVRRFGSSLGIAFPPEVSSRLQLTEGSLLYLIEAPDGGYRMLPCHPPDPKMSKAAEIMGRYRTALELLAK